jgi:hypothetical protein
MKRLFVYVPWQDASATDVRELQRNAETFVNRIEHNKVEKADARYEYSDVIKNNDFKRVRPDDTLYIYGHGAKGSPYIYASRYKCMTGFELAKQIKMTRSLNIEHKNIKLWVCHSAQGIEQREGLAYHFWQGMTRSYRLLSVYGYRGSVTVDTVQLSSKKYITVRYPGFISEAQTPEKMEILPGSAKNWRFGINPQGAIIRPSIPLELA